MNFKNKKQYQEHYALVEKHINTFFPDAEINVFHEIPTLDIHLDVYHIKPKGLEFEILMTSGMSSMAMNVIDIPNESDTYKFAELMVLIPKGVDFGEVYTGENKFDWIISMVKQSAKFPHFYDTWIGVGHSIQADENMSSYSDDTAYCGCLVLPTVTFPEEFQIIKTSNGVVNIYGLFPLYKEEMLFKIENGFNEFIQFLIKNNAEEIIDFKRENYCI
ncbi:suppressor of fused domain protein [Flammeovirga aprica]|uniref:Suppressor of fused domain protein n=1 Tax=Flammeovirga aprica JL-4 TaxID=694437 RepID=A0A7X9S0K3_9BACT|nr:suppressor of fused domain protein [Flammeovirga aprica]NME72024.1 suppressor of fused domain protein [Flammeovirga aprica JL-4]